MSRPVNQHWAPRFYLAQFATPETRDTDNPQVWIFSKNHEDGDPCVTSVRNVAAKRHLYTPRDASGNRDWEMEDRLADLETLLASMWPTLIDGFPDLHEDEGLRRGLALFIATLELRHPHTLRCVQESHEKFVRFFDGVPKDADGNPNISELEFRGVVRPFDASGYREYCNAGTEDIRRMFVKNITSNAVHIAKAMMKKRWSVVFAEQPVFITSDRPVHIENPHRERFGISTPGTTIMFPLCPTRVLIMDDMLDQPVSQYYPLDMKHGPGPWNMQAWTNCERFMIAPRNPDEVLADVMAWADANPISIA